MAKKISELNPLTGVGSATGDLFVLVDVSTNETKYMTRAELIEALGPNFTELTVDTDTLHVDTVNNRVGIKTTSPLDNLHIEDVGDVAAMRIFLSDNVADAKASLLFGTTPGARTKAAVKMINSNTGNAGGALALYTSTSSTLTERMRINSAGALLHGTTVAGSAGAGDIVVNGGIFLGGSAAANELNDYEEGTWTPELADQVSGGNTASLGTAAGKYTKIGSQVTVTAYILNIDTTGMTAGGNLSIRGLPFATTVASNRVNTAIPRLDSVTHSGATITVETGGANATHMGMKHIISGVPDTNVLVSDIVNGTADIFYSLTYKTDA